MILEESPDNGTTEIVEENNDLDDGGKSDMNYEGVAHKYFD